MFEIFLNHSCCTADADPEMIFMKSSRWRRSRAIYDLNEMCLLKQQQQKDRSYVECH